MKTGSVVKLNLLPNFSQLLLSNISLFTVLFTADVGFFLLSCFPVRDLFSSGCRHNFFSISVVEDSQRVSLPQGN